MGGFLSHLTPEQNPEVVDAPCGPIRGNVYKHLDKTVNGYLGVPYAKPPIGDLRFKKPIEIEKWAEPKDCYRYGPGCPQAGKYGKMVGDDDTPTAEDNCLTLNVFAPDWTSEQFPSGHPVMIYFYYGGFEVGMTSFLNDYSLTGTLPLRDIVLVTVNYRLGPLGFLTTGDDVAKGNYGLWDQTMALKWVHDHIAFFNGDPKNVTVFGTSAGGASADLLALSPHSNQYFHRFLASSGFGFCDFAIRTKEEQAKVFREFAQHHGYDENDSETLLTWYKRQIPTKFAEFDGFQQSSSGFLSFVPNFDGDFFPKPLDILRKEAPKMDVMLTVGEYEGLGMAMSNPAFHNSPMLFKLAIKEVYGPDVTDDSVDVQKKLERFYTNGVDKSDRQTMDKRLVEFIGDSYFNIGALDTARSCAKHGYTVYLASFDYSNPEEPPLPGLPFKASTHGSELRYILGENLMRKFTPDNEDLTMMQIMGDYVANFAKFGNPNGQNTNGNGAGSWEKYDLTRPLRYFKIDLPKSEMRENFQNGRLRIFDDINRGSKKYQKIVYGLGGWNGNS